MYDAQRAYLPTAYLVAGFPLHASCMAVSTDGRLLAVAALSMTAGATRPSSGGKGSGGGTAAAKAQPVVVLFDTLTLQPVLHIPMAGSSPVVQLQLQPDARHVLAASVNGQLRGYSCSSGSLVLDVPCCLPGPALCSALDPSGTVLIAGAAAGRLTVLGLHALAASAGTASTGSQQPDGNAPDTPPMGSGSALGASGGVITALPAQHVVAPTGTAVLGAVLVDAGRQLLTVGDGGEVCCWAFDGTACSADAGKWSDATQTTCAAQRQLATDGSDSQQSAEPCSGGVKAAEQRPALRPVFSLAADGTAAAAEAPRCAEAETPGEAPRALPAAIRCCLRPRPPSAPPQPTAGVAPAPEAAFEARPQQASTSLPATPLGGRISSKREAAFWQRQGQPQDVSLLISTAGGKRCAQVVRGERRLVVTSPCKAGGKAAPQRSAAWVDGEVAADRIPPYRPEQQLQLLPPAAAVRHVHGFEAGAGFYWMPAAGEEPAGRRHPGPPPLQQFLFAVGNVLVAGELAAEPGQQAQQRRLARLPGRITALALSPASPLAAAAVEPSPTGGSADIHLVNFEAGEVLAVLAHHSYAVTASQWG